MDYLLFSSKDLETADPHSVSVSYSRESKGQRDCVISFINLTLRPRQVVLRFLVWAFPYSAGGRVVLLIMPLFIKSDITTKNNNNQVKQHANMLARLNNRSGPVPCQFARSTNSTGLCAKESDKRKCWTRDFLLHVAYTHTWLNHVPALPLVALVCKIFAKSSIQGCKRKDTCMMRS